MEPFDKVILYGVFDGLNLSSDGSRDILVTLENGDRVDIPEYFARNASDFVEKKNIKLKDVIARIEKFDLATKAVWINEILNKLGSDYGLHKYYAGYKQGKFDGAMEREEVTVPQFVADWIERCKAKEKSLLKSLLYTPEGVNNWVDDSDNQETFARAWLDGYEVEKEKKYKVKFKNIQSGTRYLKYDGVIEKWYFGINQNSSAARLCHTKKELEEAEFGWVFDCPGMEVEEVLK